MDDQANWDGTRELLESLRSGNVSVFVGPGLSTAAGLPGWYRLISGLSARIGQELPPQEWMTGETLIDAAQDYLNQLGLHSLISYLKENLDTTGLALSAAHQALARLPVSLVFTANFDDLLERAFREAQRRLNILVSDESIPFMSRDPDSVNLVKLYGDLDQPETIVLARQHYEAYFVRRPQLVKLFEIEMSRTNVLYLGWGHTDPHFNLVFGELVARFGHFMRTGYAVMFDLPETRRRELERKHIRIVELPPGPDPTERLASWLDRLADSAADSLTT